MIINFFFSFFLIPCGLLLSTCAFSSLGFRIQNKVGLLACPCPVLGSPGLRKDWAEFLALMECRDGTRSPNPFY